MSLVQHYRGSQFQHQSVFRTISLGFQPYFPETQRYKMQLDSETFDPLSQEGYWKLGPAPQASAMDNIKMPWAIRQQAYDARAPAGRLEHLNTYSRKDMALRSASQIDLGLESSRLAMELSDIISAGTVNSAIARKYEISDTNELELTILGRHLEEFLYDEVKSVEPRSTRKSMQQSLKEDIPLGGQGLDLYFNEHMGLREGMKNIIGAKHARKSLGMEVSTAKAGTKRLSLGKQFTDDAKRVKEFEEHVANTIGWPDKTIAGSLNAELQDAMAKYYTRLIDEGGWSKIGQFGKDVQARDMFITETLRDEFWVNTTHTIDSFARRLLSRHHEVLGYQIVANKGNIDRFVEQVNLGGGWQGFVVIRGDVKMQTGSDRIFDAGAKPFPYFVVELVKVVRGDSLSEIIYNWGVQSMHDADKTIVLETLDEIQQAAIDQGSATPSRVEWLNRVKQAEFELSTIYGLKVSIGKGKAFPGEMGLTTTGIAKGLGVKIKSVLEGKDYQQGIMDFYNKMMDASNKLSTQWKSAVPVGHIHHVSIAREWTFGDGQGNPHKKYLGIWGPTGRFGAAYDNWKDSERVKGENVSISPWLVSRRAGVASFGQSGKPPR